MTTDLGMSHYCMGSEAECQGFSHGCKQAATAPCLLPTFRKEGGKLALSSGSNSFLIPQQSFPLSLWSELYHMTTLSCRER